MRCVLEEKTLGKLLVFLHVPETGHNASNNKSWNLICNSKICSGKLYYTHEIENSVNDRITCVDKATGCLWSFGGVLC